MKMKFFYSLIICLGLILSANQLWAQEQNDSLLQKNQDTNSALLNKKPVVTNRRITDTVNEEKKRISISHDTATSNVLVARKPIQLSNALKDSLSNRPDSLNDSLKALSRPVINFDSIILAKNPYLNTKSKPIFIT